MGRRVFTEPTLAISLHVQQQVLPLPRADDPLVGVIFGLLDVGDGGDEAFAEDLAERLAGVKLVDRVGLVARQGIGQTVGAALDRIGRLKVLDHAQVTAGERSRQRQVRVGVGSGHAVLDAARFGRRYRYAEAGGAVVASPVDVD